MGGDTEITTGTGNDLQQVTNLARQMVTRFGMSNIGPIALENENSGQVFLGGGVNPNTEFAESIADRIDDQVIKIIIDNRVVIDLAVEKLLDLETMDGLEFRELLSSYTILPDKKVPYVSKFK